MSEVFVAEPDRVNGAPHPRETFDLIGQSKPENEFLQAFSSGRLHHAWLITGQRGVGKATLAWQICRFLLSRPDSGSEGLFADPPPAPAQLRTDPESAISRRVASLAEPRLFLCRRPWDDKAKRLKKTITVDEVRKLKSFFSLSATDGGWRVAIVDAADEMNIAAENALLKILEEPPEKVVILLICHQPSKLLPTVRSRCRELRCGNLGPQDLTKAITAAGFDPGGDVGDLRILSNGSVGEAIRLLSDDGLAHYRTLIKLASGAPGMDRSEAIRLADSCVGKANEAQYDLILRLFSIFLSRLARFGVTGASPENSFSGEAELFSRLSRNQRHAVLWAELSQQLGARAAHARSVNLDPASVILDMCLKLDATARKI